MAIPFNIRFNDLNETKYEFHEELGCMCDWEMYLKLGSIFVGPHETGAIKIHLTSDDVEILRRMLKIQNIDYKEKYESLKERIKCLTE